jgi:hypothetical protein
VLQNPAQCTDTYAKCNARGHHLLQAHQQLVILQRPIFAQSAFKYVGSNPTVADLVRDRYACGKSQQSRERIRPDAGVDAAHPTCPDHKLLKLKNCIQLANTVKYC